MPISAPNTIRKIAAPQVARNFVPPKQTEPFRVLASKYVNLNKRQTEHGTIFGDNLPSAIRVTNTRPAR